MYAKRSILSKMNINSIILCGGQGKRLWPISSKSKPKQFIEYSKETSFLESTCERLGKLVDKHIFFTSEEYRFRVSDLIAKKNLNAEVFLEPTQKNTALPILIASILGGDPQSTYSVVVPSDHIFENKEFVQKIKLAIKQANDNNIVLLGCKPNAPNPNYGYIKVKNFKTNIFDLVKFIEKPSIDKAKSLIRSKDYLWNCGIFIFKNSFMIEIFKKFEPNLYNLGKEIVNNLQKDFFHNKYKFIRPDKDLFNKFKSISFDYLIMQNNPPSKVVRYDGKWSDIGNWNQFANIFPSDINKNSKNQILAEFIDSKNTFLYSNESKEKKYLINDVNDLLIIDTQSTLLISSKEKSENIKRFVDIKRNSKKFYDIEPIYDARPWGHYEIICNELDFGYKVKRIFVNPNASLSLQSHKHRSEHWVIVSGKAKIRVNDEIKILSKDESIYIKKNTKHQLINASKKNMLVVVEVQTGFYLGEDDIKRYEDEYGR